MRGNDHDDAKVLTALLPRPLVAASVIQQVGEELVVVGSGVIGA
jgi:hypothetical protein